MAQHGRHSSGDARRASDSPGRSSGRASRSANAGGAQPRARARTAADSRYEARTTNNQVDVIMPTSQSGEDTGAYRRRVQRRQYIETVQRRARMRRVVTFLVAALVVVGVAAAAGLLAFRGTVGSQLALRNSDARDALSAAKADEPSYTLLAAELGSVAQPLDLAGPDMIVLMQSDRQAGTLKLIGLPSGLKVTVENDTRRLGDMAEGGDAALISAVESFTKVDVSHFVKIDQGDLVGLVDELGGIDVAFDQVIDDPNAGDVYYPLGEYAVNGQGALTYLRASNLKMGKADQMRNQVDFLKLVMQRIVESERGLSAQLDAISPYFQTDLSLSDLEDAARWLGQITFDAVSCDVVPGYFTVSQEIVGDNGELYVSKTADFEGLVGASGDDPDDAEAQSVASAVEPNSFTVEVINGTDIVGAARTTAEALDAQGFRIADVGNAEQQVYDETLVIFRTKNTPAKAQTVVDEEGNVIEGGALAYDAQDAYFEGDPYAAEDDDSMTEKQRQEAQQQADAAELALGQSRAQTVINALGIGRAIEGDMYYSFNADVLLIIGYDYKPVS